MKRRIKLLGSLVIEEDERPSRIMNSAKGCALITYLIITNEVQSREKVADLLWEASSTRQSLQGLRALLVRVRKWMPELQITRQTIAFHAFEKKDIDLFVLYAGLASKDLSQLDDALQVYDGDLLASFYIDHTPRFQEWLLLAREQLRMQVLHAHRRLCVAYAEQAEWGRGVLVARRWLNLEPLDEEAHRWLMRLLAESGQRGAAVKAYEACRQILWQELAVEPEQETQLVIRRLMLQGAQTTAVAFSPKSPLTALVSDVLSEPGFLPPLAILPYRRNKDFVGREATLLQMASLLGEVPPAVVAVTGMAGVGKTQVVIEFCYRYGRYFPGGVFWMSFAEAGNVAEEIAIIGSERGLGLFNEGQQLSLVDQVRRVQRAWQEPLPRLLIFDNCEDEVLLKKWLPVTGGCRVLFTSRRGTWAREINISTIPLHTLSSQESVIYLQRAAPHLANFDAVEIGQEVGHLPLALHLAGGYLRRYRLISPAQYLEQLRDKGLLQHPSFQGRGSRHSPTGHDLDVARTFMVNTQNLNPHDAVDRVARQLLGRATCFAPGEPIPRRLLIATIATADDMMMLLLGEDGLARLATLGLLLVDAEGTAVMHRLIAAFTTKTILTEEEFAEAQMAVENQLVIDLTAHHRQEGHLSVLPFSVTHLRYVVNTAISRKTSTSASLAAQLGRHLVTIGNYVEAETYLKQAFLVAYENGEVYAQAQLLITLASTQESLGHDQDALLSSQQAVTLLKSNDEIDMAKLAEALYRKGWAHFRLGQAAAALDAAYEGVLTSQTENIRDEMARCLSLMGVVNYYLLGNYTLGMRQLQESLTIYEELEYRNGQSSVLNNMGENARLQGNFAQAVTYYEAALAIAREIENLNRENLFLSNLCGAQLRLGHLATAVSGLEQLMSKTGKDWYGMSEASRFLAEAYLGQGKAEAALMMAQQAFVLANNEPEVGRAWRVLGLIAAQLNETIKINDQDDIEHDASRCFLQSLTYFERLELDRDRAITLWRWAQYELAKGDQYKGHTMWRDAQEIFKHLNLPLFIAMMEP